MAIVNEVQVIYENILKNMFDGYALGEIIYNEKGEPIDFILLDVNPAFEEITELKKNNVLGKKIIETYKELNSKWLTIFGEVALKGQNVKFQLYSTLFNKLLRINISSPKKGDFIIILKDVTDYEYEREALEKHKILFQNAYDIIFYLNEEGNILLANKKAVDTYGYSFNELLNLNVKDLRYRSRSMTSLYENQMKASEDGGIVFESIHVKKDSSTFPVEISSKTVKVNGKKMRIHIIRDITERKEVERKIAYMANYDALTGIRNRSNIMEQLQIAIDDGIKNDEKFALIIFDIDKFKRINDTYGHQAGDKVLKHTTQVIQCVLRKTDLIGRFGGDEFIIIERFIDQKGDIINLIKRISHALEKPVNIGHQQIKINISMGISLFPEDADMTEFLINQADSAMYVAKKTEGYSYVFYQK
jgi:diguanylate cyclase (GGDEF)-like protein/PAS domain S-box-containing protein